MRHRKVVHQQVQCFVSLSFSLCPFLTFKAFYVTGDLPFGYALVIKVSRQILGKMQRTRAFTQRVTVIDPVFGRIGTNQPQLSALLLYSAFPGHINFGRPLGYDRSS